MSLVRSHSAARVPRSSPPPPPPPVRDEVNETLEELIRRILLPLPTKDLLCRLSVLLLTLPTRPAVDRLSTPHPATAAAVVGAPATVPSARVASVVKASRLGGRRQGERVAHR